MSIKASLQQVPAVNNENNNYELLDNLPRINGITLLGDVSLQSLDIAPANIADSCLINATISIDNNWILSLILNKKNGTSTSSTIQIPKDVYNDVILNDSLKTLTFIKKDSSTTEISLVNLFNDYVLKTTSIGSNTLENDITADNIMDDIKDLVATLTNKTISADDNVISELEVDNFKNSAINTNINEPAVAVDTQFTTQKSVKDYVIEKAITSGVLSYIENSNYPSFYKQTLTLTNSNNDIIVDTDDNGKWVDADSSQSLVNKTINCGNNILQFGNNTLSANRGFWINNNKLWYSDENGNARCLNDEYKINNLTIPQSLSGQLLTDDSLSVNSVDNDIEIKITTPTKTMNYADYSNLSEEEKMKNIVYVIVDYPSPDVIETREMINGEWQITRTNSTLDLLTFIYKKVVHNYYTYYTKPEVNTLLDYKEDVINGAGSTIAHHNLTPNRLLISDVNGKIGVSEYSQTALINVATILEPTISISTTGGQYISNAECKIQVVNADEKIYNFYVSFDISTATTLWRKGTLMVLTLPENWFFNFKGINTTFFAFILNSDQQQHFLDERVYCRYTSNTTLQIILPETNLLSNTGHCTLSFQTW